MNTQDCDIIDIIPNNELIGIIKKYIYYSEVNMSSESRKVIKAARDKLSLICIQLNDDFLKLPLAVALHHLGKYEDNPNTLFKDCNNVFLDIVSDHVQIGFRTYTKDNTFIKFRSEEHLDLFKQYMKNKYPGILDNLLDKILPNHEYSLVTCM